MLASLAVIVASQMCSSPLQAQTTPWDTNGSGIWYAPAGINVGIGVTAPAKNGAVTPHTQVTQIMGALVLGGTGQGGNQDGLIQYGNFNFSGGNNWNGYGAFGTNLAVQSGGNTDTFYTPLTHPSLGYAGMVTGTSGIQFVAFSGATTGGAAMSPATRMFISPSGNVGIGTGNTVPAHTLHVAGTIGAEEVIVSSTGADYVFQPDYRLQPLSEVNAFIQENHHLPEVPSAAEMRAGGLSLGEMQTKLLAKVEELTLHMIELEQENHDLKQIIRRLEDATLPANGVSIRDGRIRPQ
jgi:hypothetical protein